MAIPKDIPAYLATVPLTHRPALVTLRKTIKKLYPRVTEHISYRIPLFKLDGHPLVAFRASKNHLGLFVWSGKALGTIPKSVLKGYDLGKGTVRFSPEKPLPERVVKAVLAARAKEIKKQWG